VAQLPGSAALTRIPVPRNSLASITVTMFTAAFDEL
jgi:hypothetical protein